MPNNPLRMNDSVTIVSSTTLDHKIEMTPLQARVLGSAFERIAGLQGRPTSLREILRKLNPEKKPDNVHVIEKPWYCACDIPGYRTLGSSANGHAYNLILEVGEHDELRLVLAQHGIPHSGIVFAAFNYSGNN
ncbi:hypothetical protein HY637_03380 [Candidatus Woesearchaeota archaeon]|nr:hypothetical protein [Candidatus Woesearchaeota archaeon]